MSENAAARRRAAAGLGMLLILAWSLGCSQEIKDLPPLEPMPAMSLDSIEPAAREQIEEAEDVVDEARRESRRALADAWGAYGEVVHAYDLESAARVAYANAATLDPDAFAWAYLGGVLAQDAGDLETARERFGRAVELQPRSAPARLRFAEALLASGLATEARLEARAVADAIDSESYAAAAAYAEGRALARLGEHAMAVEQLERAAEAAPEAGAVRHALGESLRRLQRTDEAAAALAASGAEPPPIADPLLERVRGLARGAGAALRRSNQALVAGDLPTAERALRDGLDSLPRDAPQRLELYLNLAAVEIRRQDPSAALAVLEEARERFPESARVRHDLGTAHLALGDAEKAVEALRRSLELEPDSTDARFNLANALAALERWPEARAELERVLEARPDEVRARYLLAMSMAQTGRPREAVPPLRALLADEPLHRPSIRGLADVLSQTGDRRGAVAVYERAVEAAASRPVAERAELFDEAARVAWKHGQRQRALDFWRRWVELEPASSEAATALANALQLAGQRDEARVEFARAVALDPQNATAWLSEIPLWILAGEFATARTRAEEALSFHPEHPGLAATTARLLATAPDAAVRDGQRALDLARVAYGKEPSTENAETLAMAFAEVGAFEKAIRLQRNLARQAQAQNRRQELARLVANLRRYEQREPIRAAPGR